MGVSRDCSIFSVPPIISGTGKATNFKFGRYIQGVHPNKSPIKNFGEKGAWAYPGTVHFSGTPYYLRSGKSYSFQFGQYIQRVHPNKRPFKILEKRERVRIQGLPNFFGYPLLSQERVKLRTSNFACTFYRFNGNKSPLKIL